MGHFSYTLAAKDLGMDKSGHLRAFEDFRSLSTS